MPLIVFGSNTVWTCLLNIGLGFITSIMPAQNRSRSSHRNRSWLLVAISSLLVLTSFLPSHPGVILPSAIASSPSATGLSSWNPNVNCTPIVVTVEQVLGSQTNSQGGATENGSIFNPGITSSYGPDNTKRWLTPSSMTPPGWVPPGPPCTITNAQGQVVSAFVQINGVERSYPGDFNWNQAFAPINGGGNYTNGLQSDTAFNVLTPGYSLCTSTNTTNCMHMIHVQIDRDWKGAGYCGPSTSCDNSTLVAETAPYTTLVDVQGFVFWNPNDLNDNAHGYTGWELHPLTAWRISSFYLSANPNPLPVMPGQSSSSTVSVSASSQFSGSVSFTSTVSSGPGSSGPTPTAVVSPSSISLQSGGGGSATLTVTTVSSDVGDYTVTVTGANGNATRSVSVAVYVVDFSIQANPSSLSVPIGSSGQSTIMLASINGFAGDVSLTSQVSPASISLSQPTATLSPSDVFLTSGGSGSAVLTVSASLLTTPGTYTVTVTGFSGGVSHSTTVTVMVTVAGII